MSRPHPGRSRSALAAAAAAAILVVAACDVGGNGSQGPVDTSSAGPLDTGIAEQSLEPEGTEAPESSESTPGVPGFAAWHLIHPEDVQVGTTESGLAMTLLKKAPWSDSSQGVLFYTRVEGNFRISASVSTWKTSDSSEDPGGGGITEFAGLMARATTARENYVFIVSGADATGLSVETTSTTDGHGVVAGRPSDSGDADLQLCRIGTAFTLWKRPLNSDADYTLAATYQRPDLSGPLEVGANIFSDNTPDLTAEFDDLSIDSLGPGDSCTG